MKICGRSISPHSATVVRGRHSLLQNRVQVKHSVTVTCLALGGDLHLHTLAVACIAVLRDMHDQPTGYPIPPLGYRNTLGFRSAASPHFPIALTIIPVRPSTPGPAGHTPAHHPEVPLHRLFATHSRCPATAVAHTL